MNNYCKKICIPEDEDAQIFTLVKKHGEARTPTNFSFVGNINVGMKIEEGKSAGDHKQKQ